MSRNRFLRVRRQVGQIADPPVGDIGGIKLGNDRFPVGCPEHLRDLGFKDFPMHQALLVVAEPVIRCDIFITQYIAAEGNPLPLILDGEQNLFAISADKRPIGRD